jgi:hypothetical protein
MLLQAYVKSIYFAGVERVNEEFVLWLLTSPLKVYGRL